MMTPKILVILFMLLSLVGQSLSHAAVSELVSNEPLDTLFESTEHSHHDAVGDGQAGTHLEQDVLCQCAMEACGLVYGIPPSILNGLDTLPCSCSGNGAIFVFSGITDFSIYRPPIFS